MNKVEGFVHNFVKDINIYKLYGFNDISYVCLRDDLLVLIPQLSYIFKQAVKTGKFAEKLKIATIVPIFNGGKKDEV